MAVGAGTGRDAAWLPTPGDRGLVLTLRAGGEIIASGQHTASRMMGLVATHFSRRDDGVPREMLCLNFNFAFKAPVFAEQDIAVVWRVAEVEASARRGGCIGHLAGEARVGGRACVVGRGTVLVKRAASSNP